MILNYIKKSLHSKYRKKLCTKITLWSCSNFGNLLLLYSNKTYESTACIIQLYNLAKMRKGRNRSTIQFFEVEFPLQHLFWSPHMDSPPLKMTKTPNPSKEFFRTKKSSPEFRGGGHHASGT